jgi:hypothetical protein
MADLGSIGRQSMKYNNADVVSNGRCIYRALHIGKDTLVAGGQDFNTGNPTPPSLRMDSKGLWTFNWPVDNRARTIFVDVMQTVNLSPRPRLVLSANSNIGVSANTNDAASSATWVTCQLSFTPTGTGVVIIGFESMYDGQFAQCPTYWDNFREVLT